MTENTRHDFLGAMRRATDSALLAMDLLAREMSFPPGSSGAVTLEAQREIILAVATMAELVAEVRQNQDEFLTSPEFSATVERAMRIGADGALKEVAGEMQRRSSSFTAAVILAVLALGWVSFKVAYDAGYNSVSRTTVADCARGGTPMAPERQLACSRMIPPKLDSPIPIGIEPGGGKDAPPVFRYASPADGALPVPPR